MAAAAVRVGTPSSGKPTISVGDSSAAPEIPDVIAIAAMATHTGNMNA